MKLLHRLFLGILPILLTAVVFVFAPVSEVQAQTGLNYQLSPNYGTSNLSSGFLPDPFTVNMISGGSVSISSFLTGAECRGYATSAPDYRIRLSGSSSFIRFFFVGNGDTTLVVNSASGNWYCDDDSFGTLNPSIDLNSPSNGTYDIWVGSFSSGRFISGTLYITELSSVNPTSTRGISITLPTRTPVPQPPPPVSNSGRLDYTLAANYGVVNLRSGFLPDPYSYSMTSGGSVSISSFLTGNECRGYATSAPDLQLNLQGTSRLLRFFFVSTRDTTLVVNDARGNWYCDDDSFGTLDPTIDLSNAGAGSYDVWIGSFVSGQFNSGRLYITELSSVDPGDY